MYAALGPKLAGSVVQVIGLATTGNLNSKTVGPVLFKTAQMVMAVAVPGIGTAVAALVEIVPRVGAALSSGPSWYLHPILIEKGLRLGMNPEWIWELHAEGDYRYGLGQKFAGPVIQQTWEQGQKAYQKKFGNRWRERWAADTRLPSERLADFGSRSFSLAVELRDYQGWHDIGSDYRKFVRQFDARRTYERQARGARIDQGVWVFSFERPEVLHTMAFLRTARTWCNGSRSVRRWPVPLTLTSHKKDRNQVKHLGRTYWMDLDWNKGGTFTQDGTRPVLPKLPDPLFGVDATTGTLHAVEALSRGLVRKLKATDPKPYAAAEQKKQLEQLQTQAAQAGFSLTPTQAAVAANYATRSAPSATRSPGQALQNPASLAASQGVRPGDLPAAPSSSTPLVLAGLAAVAALVGQWKS